MMEIKGAEVKCFICGEWIPLKESKSGKPHGFCRACGLQVFFRQQACIDLLVAGLKSGPKDYIRQRSK